MIARAASARAWRGGAQIKESNMRRIVFLLALALGAAPVCAADKDGAYGSRRPASCKEYLKVYRLDERQPGSDGVRKWIAGYITAYNRQTPETYNILGISEFDQVLQSVARYCKERPLSDIAAAMESVTDDLYATRHQTRRQAGH
jgi:hypothetical protein